MNIKNLFKISMLLCASTMLVTSCGENETNPSEVTISIDGTILAVDETKTITVKADGKVVSSGFTFDVSDTSVIDVSNNGVVTGKAIGTSNITATYKEVTSNTLTVTVKNNEDDDDDDTNYSSKEDSIYALRDSIFQTKDLKTKTNLGLSSLSSVGIIEDEFKNQVLYPELSSYDHVYNVSDYGVIESSQENNYNFANLINEIKNNEINSDKYLNETKCIRFESNKTYYFTSGFDFTGLNNIYLVGNNTEIVLGTWGTYIKIGKCNNFHVIGLSFDMNPSPTIAGVVKSYNGTDNNGDHKVTLKINDEFNLSNGVYKKWNPLSTTGNGWGSYMECSYNNELKRYIPDSEKNLMYNTTSSNVSYKGIKGFALREGSNEIDLVLSKSFPWYSNSANKFVIPEEGTVVSLAFTMYDYFGFDLKNSNKVYFEHVNCYVTGGMGFHVADGKDIYLNKFDFKIKEGSTRIMTCTADIIHTASLCGDLKITNCTFEASHDDGLNIKQAYGRVGNVNKSAKEITINATTNDSTTPFEVGDVIDFYDYSTMEHKGRFNITGSRRNGNSYVVTVDSRPSDIESGFIVGNDTQATKLYLHNCLIQNKRNRGILVQCRHSEISNCTFRNVLMGAVKLLGVGDSNAEGIIPQNVVVKDNKFLTCKGVDFEIMSFGTGNKITTGAINKVELANNLFYNPRSLAINLQGAGETNMHNNFFSYDSMICNIMIQTQYAKDIIIKDNVCNLDNNRRLDEIQFVTQLKETSNFTMENNLVTGGLE